MERLSQDHLYCIFRKIRKRGQLLKLRLVAGAWYHAVNRVFVERKYYVNLGLCSSLLQIARLSWVRYIDLKENCGLAFALTDWPLKGLAMECPRRNISGKWELPVAELSIDVSRKNQWSICILEHFPYLKHLKIYGDNKHMTRENFQDTSHDFCPDIRKLRADWNLTYYRSNDAEAEKTLNRERPNWKILKKLRCNDISGGVTRYLQCLQKLSLMEVEGGGLSDKLIYLTGLRELKLKGNIDWENFDDLPKFLTKLTITNTWTGGRCKRRPEDKVDFINITHPELVSLTLIYIEGVILDTPKLRNFTYMHWKDLPVMPTTLETLFLSDRLVLFEHEKYDLSYLSRLRSILLVDCRGACILPAVVHKVSIVRNPIIVLPQTTFLKIEVLDGLPEHLAQLLSITPCHTLKLRVYDETDVKMQTIIPGIVCLSFKCKNIERFDIGKRVFLPLGARELTTNVVPENLQEMIAHGLRRVRLKRCHKCVRRRLQSEKTVCTKCKLPLQLECPEGVTVEYD